MSRQQDTDRFYELMGRLASRTGGPRFLRDSTNRTGWPSHGVYFFFEPGEVRLNGEPRIVRVGTHALLSTSNATLWKRLSQHRGPVGGRTPGGGNHRGSIFRLHVGASLISRGDASGLPLAVWLAPDVAPEHAEAELSVERMVTRYIGQMPVLWADVPTRSDGTSDRGLIEANSIGLLSVAAGGLDPASASWLGRHAPNTALRGSGLWNVRNVLDQYTPAALDVLEQYVTK